MGRKPYKKIKLTPKEYDLVEEIARVCFCEWFSIAGDTIDISNGKVVNKVRHTDYDECYDWETKHYTSLQFGLRLLDESFHGTLVEMGFTPEEESIWNNLLNRIK